MYVAGRPLTMNLGEVRPTGAPVPEAEGWSYPVLRAHLDWGLLQKIPDEESPQSNEQITSSVDDKKNKKSKRPR